MPPVPVMNGIEHPARGPLVVHLEPLHALQVQSAEDLLGTRAVPTYPVACWLATGACKRETRPVAVCLN